MNDFFILMRQELAIIVILFVLLFLKVSSKELRNGLVIQLANGLLFLNLVGGFFFSANGSLFGDMFYTNPLVVFEKNLLNLGTFIISLQSYNWLKDHKHVAEFYMLLLASLLGMFYILSTGNILMFYLALELSTIPLAALANFNPDQRRSPEAAFKMIVSSAFASALLLFGISLLYGSTGNLGFDSIGEYFKGSPLDTFAFILILAGFGFKISAVPFHLWTADVYEGAPVAVTSYLSVISKGTLLFALLSVLYKVFYASRVDWYNMLIVLSALSMMIGNLFALRQQNLKRFLAFSSIAQVGFILIGITGYSIEGSSSVVYFVLIYLFSNLAAFGVVSVVSAATGKETINDYKAFYKTNPLLAWVLTLALFSLAGIPPTAGFFGKFFLLLAGAAKNNYPVIIFAALNMVLSLYYYLRIVKAMFMDANETPIEKIIVSWQPKLSMAICVAGILITGLASGGYNYIVSLFALY